MLVMDASSFSKQHQQAPSGVPYCTVVGILRKLLQIEKAVAVVSGLLAWVFRFDATMVVSKPISISG